MQLQCFPSSFLRSLLVCALPGPKPVPAVARTWAPVPRPPPRPPWPPACVCAGFTFIYPSAPPSPSRPPLLPSLLTVAAVSWAEELETVKEIAPQEASPMQPWQQGSPMRARLAAAGQQHLLLTTFVLLLMIALLVHRMGLGSML